MNIEAQFNSIAKEYDCNRKKFIPCFDDFYEISTNKMIPVTLPTEIEMLRFNSFLQKIRTYNPASTTFTINPNKCRHCIYCNLCEKTDIDNVYT